MGYFQRVVTETAVETEEESGEIGRGEELIVLVEEVRMRGEAEEEERGPVFSQD